MSITTVVPTAIWSQAGTFVATGGAATIVGNLSDVSDTSTVKKSTSGSSDQLGLAVAAVTVPSTAVVQSVQVIVRHSRPHATSNLRIQLGIKGSPSLLVAGGGPGSYSWFSTTFSLSGIFSLGNYVSPQLTTATRNWSAGDVANLVVKIIDTGSATDACTLYDVSVVVVTNDRPVVTVTTPTGTITDTTTPLTQWTYTDTEGDTPSLFWVKIFPSSVYSAAGFNPDTDPGFVATTGLATGGPSGAYCSTPLAGNGNYRSYVKLGSYNGLYIVWSDWAFSGFTLTLLPPGLPTLTGGWVPATAATALSFSGHTNMLAADDADAGATVGNWVPDVNCAVTRSTTQALTGSASVRLSSTAAGTMTAVIANSSAGREPINASIPYTAMASFRAGATGRTCRVGVRWLNASNATIQTDYSPTITSVTTGWTTASYLFTPPAGATSALVVLEVQATAGASELHYCDDMALYPGAANLFQNLAPNPSVEVDLTNWFKLFGDPNCSINQDTVHAFHGTKSIRCNVTTATSADVAFGQTINGLTPGLTYTASVYVYNDPTHPVPSINMQIPFQVVGTSTTATGALTRLSVTWVQDVSGSTFPTIQATGSLTTSMLFWADAMQVEPGSTPTAFQVSSGAWTPGGYTGFFGTIERSDDGGNTWQPVLGSPFVLDPITQRVTVSDYEASRGTVAVGGSPEYRAKALATNAANGLTISSDYISPITVPTVNDGQWWLKCLAAPQLNLSPLRVKENVPYTRDEEVGVFAPLGNSNKVVVHGDLHGEDGQLQILAVGPAEQAALETLADRQDTLYLQDSQGGGKRIQWSAARQRTLEGTASPAVHTYQLAYVETD